jgi:hypothetical protein
VRLELRCQLAHALGPHDAARAAGALETFGLSSTSSIRSAAERSDLLAHLDLGIEQLSSADLCGALNAMFERRPEQENSPLNLACGLPPALAPVSARLIRDGIDGQLLEELVRDEALLEEWLSDIKANSVQQEDLASAAEELRGVLKHRNSDAAWSPAPPAPAGSRLPLHQLPTGTPVVAAAAPVGTTVHTPRSPARTPG